MRSIINEVLVCRPTFFQIEYVINPWMKDQKIDQGLAMKQWEAFCDAYSQLGIKVQIIDQVEGLPDMVFTADQAVVKDNIALMSNFAESERKGEENVYRQWFKDRGYELKFLPEKLSFEGNGELHFWNDRYFVGTGFRTSEESRQYIEEILGQPVISLKLIDPYFYHLDTCLLPLDSETVFYYPPAFDTHSQQVLKKTVPNLVEFSREDLDYFTANSVVHGSTILCQKALPEFRKKVEDMGFSIIELDVSEFNKSGGGIHCLTNILATQS